ncbi:carboxylesterase family protein [Mediterraneibacter glycyrrhizinilyticus]|nr:carboxylesterase family protein [Mediterraneibacter glycyrrhizinilyticus]MBM6854605.1 carboxylesterase family protein [Mediterraneibacter glycyrrhizinilyticus]
MEKVIVKTKQGRVSGQRFGRFVEFKGIPYGKAERFCEAVMYQWEGVLDCTEFGKKALQFPAPLPQLPEPEPEEHFGEDCLNLNIYTPDISRSLPVLVDIHGGAFQNGSNRDHTPDKMTEDKDIVYVNLNYRLGVFGYLYLGQILGEKYRTSGNNGLTDQLLALRWVHENISAFGGDPQRVTVMGASAGAKSIAALMMFPESRTYFSQALLSSGAYQCIRDERTAEKVAERYLEILEIRDPSEILTMDAESLLQAQKELCSAGESTCVFGPVADGLFGINAETAKEDHEKLCRDVICEKGICDEEKKKEIWIKIFSDYMYRTYSERMAKILMRNGSTVYKYSMEYAPALHCQDQSFAFETKDGGEMYRDGSTLEERNRLGRTIFEAYTNFIRTGDPNGAGVPYWSEYREGGFLQMNWDAVSGEAPEEADDTLKRFPEQVYRLR